MSLPPLALHSCWRCSAHLAGEPSVVQAVQRTGAGTYCARCEPIVKAEEAAIPCLPGRRCVHVQYQRGPFAEMVITKVDGDQVTVMRLGFPDGVPAGAHGFHHTIGRGQFTRGELLMKGL